MKQSHCLQELVWDSNNVGLKGIKLILEGVQASSCLKKLSIKNINIGDTGVKLIAEGLFNNKLLEELDISSNSVTIEGFIPLCDSILTNKIKVLKSKNNLLGDDSMKYFAKTVLSNEEDENKEGENSSANGNIPTNNNYNMSSKKLKDENILFTKNNVKEKKIKLEYFDFSSSKIYDQGLIYLLHQLQYNTSVKKVKLSDNYFTHEVDLLLVEYLDKNNTLIKFEVEKNRLSYLCMSKVKEIIERNRKQLSEKEPNRLLVEVYRLRYENTKLDEMKDSLRYLENNVEKVKLNRADLRQEFDTFKRGIDEEYDQLKKRLEKHNGNHIKSTNELKNLEIELEKTNEENKINLEELDDKYNEMMAKKLEMEMELEQLKKQYNEEETAFIVNYDKVRSNAQANVEKTKVLEEDAKKLLDEIKSADKLIYKYKKQGKIPN